MNQYKIGSSSFASWLMFSVLFSAENYLLTFTAFGCVPLYTIDFTQKGELSVMTRLVLKSRLISLTENITMSKDPWIILR